MRWSRGSLLWGMFFLMAFGLGYPTLNRYSPADTPGVQDAASYSRALREGAAAAPVPFRYRVLVPGLARPVYRIAEGRVGSWDPAFFSLLVVNAALVALTALLTVVVGMKVLPGSPAPLLAGLLLLVDFAVPNLHLAGLVDSAELLLLLMLAGLLLTGRWWSLPLLGLAGGLAKETFVPMGAAFALAWWVASRRRNPNGAWRALAGVVGLLVLGLASVFVVRSVIDGHPIWPWDVVADNRGKHSIPRALLEALADPGFWYSFVWLLPLAAPRLGELPAEWRAGAGAAAVTALAMGVWQGAGPNIGRPVFNAIAPLLALAAALQLLRLFRNPASKTALSPAGEQ